MVIIKLPWPPSINTYWRRNGGRYFISKEGQTFRDKTIVLAHRYKNAFKDTDKLSVLIEAYPPDKRRRDLDNICKAVLDSLQHAHVYSDDSQIDKLTIWRCMPYLGEIVITVGLA